MVQDAQAEVSAVSSPAVQAPGDLAPASVYYGCIYKVGRQVRLTKT